MKTYKILFASVILSLTFSAWGFADTTPKSLFNNVQITNNCDKEITFKIYSDTDGCLGYAEPMGGRLTVNKGQTGVHHVSVVSFEECNMRIGYPNGHLEFDTKGKKEYTIAVTFGSIGPNQCVPVKSDISF